MKIMFDCAMRWEIVECGRNPMSLVRIKTSKPKPARLRYRLTPKQVGSLLAEFTEPYRPMAVIAVCLALRASEVAGLQWGDFNWLDGSVLIQRSFVLGGENEVKTQGSRKRLPLDPDLQAVVLQYNTRCEIPGNPWVFVNPATGVPYSMTNAQSNRLEPAGRAAGIGEGLGWHSFRHTYSSLLRALKVDIKVQQELLRHADIRTTMNIYTEAVSESLREANSRIVRLLLQ